MDEKDKKKLHSLVMCLIVGVGLVANVLRFILYVRDLLALMGEEEEEESDWEY